MYKMRNLAYGVGINNADYVIRVVETVGNVNGKYKQRLVWMCPFYQRWRSMLERCYSCNYQGKYPTYVGCTVCEEWLTFSNFKAWMETQDWEGKELDKDLLVIGNKVYSAETCIFVASVINCFVTERGAGRGIWPLGCYWNKKAGKFHARCCNPFTGEQEHLGLFTSPTEAHQAWLTRKLELAKLLAAEQNDPRVAKALINRYENFNK